MNTTQLFQHRVLLAPMAGITDRPFRQLCRSFGADAAVSEMTSSNPALLSSRKTRLRLDHEGESSPKIVQIAGAVPDMMADAARFNIDHGAEIIDINMGCPAKKVCNVMAGSALLRNEKLVADILTAVVKAASVPVTLKMRTGWDVENKNAVRIAAIAESTGIQRIAIHGRTRACAYRGQAEYDTVAEVKSRINIPVIANGDIDSAEKAAKVLHTTGADGVMIGRAAQGNPWIFREIKHYLLTGELPSRPEEKEISRTLIKHLHLLYEFYGEHMGVRIARKHIAWYCQQQPDYVKFRAIVNQAGTTTDQLRMVKNYFSQKQENKMELAA